MEGYFTQEVLVCTGNSSPCISCGFALLFDALNVSAQCRNCNRGGATVEMYARGLNARYGPGTAEELKERYRDCHFKGKTTKNGRRVNTKRSSRN